MRTFDLCSPTRRLRLGLALAVSVSGWGAPVLSEFAAANDSGLRDEEGAVVDWIEIHNPDAGPVSLAGYHLTDDPANLNRWTFPATTLEAGGYLVVFASGKNRTDPAAPLHTDFQLAAGGEYLALVAPDGVTPVSAFAPSYPPQFTDESFGIHPAGPPPAWTFYPVPTPGAPNGNGLRAGPMVTALEPNPPPAAPGPLTLRVQVLPANDPVATVTLHYRRMFAPETAVPMRDDGTGGDVAAGDGIWTGGVPGAALAAGEMTRWRFVASDSRGTQTREPAYHDPLDAPQYFGTVATDAGIRSALPVLHWFTTNPAGAGTTAGSRGAVYYEGEFYDNVRFTLHGQSSAGFPKKSYNVDFNRPQRFRWSPEAPRVADLDLLSNWADKSKVRHVLAYEVMRLAGVPAHFAFTVRVQQNGNFFSTADLVEDADEIYLERAGLNPEGALYKVYNNLLNKDAGNTGSSGVEKKTRRTEDNRDLQALIDGLDLTGPALERYLFDHIDLPRCVNLLAASSVIRNIDMHSKNWYICCDTGRSGEWAILPWDLDLSHGRFWNPQDTYFDNTLYTDGYVVNGTAIRLVSHLFAHPALRAMILRRIRTLTDRFLQPPPAPGTPENSLYYERRLNELSALLDPPAIVPSDARLDFEKWGSWLQGGAVVRYTNASPAVETLAEAIQRWKTEYLPGRRAFIYGTQIVGRGGEIPPPQTGGDPTTITTPLVVKGAPAKILVPANDTLGVTWTGNPALEPFATTGWTTGTTGVGYERATGYEALIGTDVYALTRSNNSVYVRIAFDVAAPTGFDRLELRMKCDDGFAAYLNGVLLTNANAPDPLRWNSAAVVSREANPAAFTSYDVSGKLASLRTGRNVLAIHALNDSVNSSDLIVVPELHAGRVVPASTLEPGLTFGTLEATPVSGNPDEEFIQLLNPHPQAVDISGWRLAGGITHTFLGGTVIPPNGALYVCPSAAAFRARSRSPKGGEGLFIQGGYEGRLASVGETLLLLDGSGMTNAVATYQGAPSDAQRHLVVTELLYDPAGDARAEFIELLNTSDSVTVDLRGVRFTRGVDFDFTGSAITSLAPGARALVVRDVTVFRATYGPDRPVAGAFANGTALSNGGERIRLEDADQATVQDFTYANAAPWPASAGAGWSLVLLAPRTHPDPTLAVNWRASTRPGGNPGWPDDPRFPEDPRGDADGNGERDLIDYALGNETGRSPIVPTLSHVPGLPGAPVTLHLSHPASLTAESVRLGYAYSTDLATWQDAAGLLELVSREPLGTGLELVTWRLTPPPGNGSRLFLRLRATLP